MLADNLSEDTSVPHNVAVKFAVFKNNTAGVKVGDKRRGELMAPFLRRQELTGASWVYHFWVGKSASMATLRECNAKHLITTCSVRPKITVNVAGVF